MPKRYRKLEEDNIDSYRPQPLSLDRPGISYLHSLIENGEIGLVAAQNIDRLA